MKTELLISEIKQAEHSASRARALVVMLRDSANYGGTISPGAVGRFAEVLEDEIFSIESALEALIAGLVRADADAETEAAANED